MSHFLWDIIEKSIHYIHYHGSSWESLRYALFLSPGGEAAVVLWLYIYIGKIQNFWWEIQPPILEP
jgi:hypothetical protein